MIEFGEKIKKLREEKGMTQQTMAEQLFVTRQAVSRWECGARYPDLLMTKKIASLLETTIDDLVSDEELKRDIQKEPVFMTSRSNLIQILLFLICAVHFFVLTVNSAYVNYPLEISKTNGLYDYTYYMTNLFLFSMEAITMLTGMFYGIKNGLSPHKTGIVMSIPLGIELTSPIIVFFMFFHKDFAKYDWIIWFYMLIPLTVIAIINLFFNSRKNISPIPIYVISVVTLILSLYRLIIMVTTFNAHAELRTYFTTLFISVIGKIAFATLLSCQAYALNTKRRIIEDKRVSLP